ncbi:hypothetical protein [Methylosinus sp. Sm6]|uniref:hypothetical protein n=1 Tax=Methylosinus sp. Sm6 TaxID=2866948 RepID=UPI001C999697|nr:hypothetical protein [Methylosinus sp. Sm6]MBY6239812.1 hypothetical protein [Methylosinus sp. Sm6]
MSLFRDAFAAADADFDDNFGEPLQIIPVVVGEFLRNATPATPPLDVVGILDLPTDILAVGRERDGARSEVIVQTPFAEFALQHFGPGAPLPKEGDEIVAPSRPGAPRYRVLSVKPDGVSRIICQLAAL